MRIAICDDERHFINCLSEAVYTYSNLHRLEIAIDEYLCGEDLLSSQVNYDMVFLDYKMTGIDGLETARQLRKRNLNCTIIFCTNHPHFFREAFEVSTYRFFEKPLDINKLHKALDDYLAQFGNDYPLLLKVNRDTVCVQTNSIVYLEADNKKCFVNLVDKRLHCAKTMAGVASLLPSNIFYKVNKAFIVNFNYIDKYSDNDIFFKNGAYVHASRKYLASFKAAYKNYARNLSIMKD